MTAPATPITDTAAPRPLAGDDTRPSVVGPGGRSRRTGEDPNAWDMPSRLRDLDHDQRRRVEMYVTRLAHELELGHWTITIGWDESCADDCDAQVSDIGGRNAAVVWLHDHFFSLTLTEQRRVLCHELLHLHTAPLREAFRTGARAVDSKMTRRTVMRYVTDAEERLVDSLSMVIGTHLPLPGWAEPANPERALSATASLSSAPIPE